MPSLSVQRVGVGMGWIKNLPGQRSSRGRSRLSCWQVRAGMSVCRTRGVRRQQGIKRRETPWPCLSESLLWHQITGNCLGAAASEAHVRAPRLPLSSRLAASLQPRRARTPLLGCIHANVDRFFSSFVTSCKPNRK